MACVTSTALSSKGVYYGDTKWNILNSDCYLILSKDKKYQQEQPKSSILSETELKEQLKNLESTIDIKSINNESNKLSNKLYSFVEKYHKLQEENRKLEEKIKNLQPES